MSLKREDLADGWTWWRIADAGWRDPLDPSFAAERGGRWNPPASFPTLYLNEDLVTARLDLRTFIAAWPYEPEDLRSDNGPVLVAASLPRAQTVCDAHTPEGLKAAGLPVTYPLDSRRALVPRDVCQAVGATAKSDGLRGVRARSARAPNGAGRELAWFPATARSRANRDKTLRFEAWFWA